MVIPGDDALHEGSLLHQAGEVPAAPVHPITNYISLELQIRIILFGSGFGRNLLLVVFLILLRAWRTQLYFLRDFKRYR